MKQPLPSYREALRDIAAGLDDLMADLEDLRDEAQECLDQTGGADARADVARIDAALRKLGEAADALGEGD